MSAHKSVDVTPEDARQSLVRYIMRASAEKLEELMQDCFGHANLARFHVYAAYEGWPRWNVDELCVQHETPEEYDERMELDP